MKKALILISIVILSANVFAQSWPTGSSTRPTFSGFGVTSEDESSEIFENNTASTTAFAGDYIKSEDDGFGTGNLNNPGTTNPDDVPIVESILGILGLGGAYAWRLFSKKRKDEE